MRVADRLARREEAWRELEVLVVHFEGGKFRRPLRRGGEIHSFDQGNARADARPASAFHDLIRLGELYRSACADLMLAEAHDLPRDTVSYLHSLVARAHNVVYRAQGFRFRRWAAELFVEVPRRLRADPMLRLSALAFWGTFLLFFMLGAGRPHFAAQVVGDGQLEAVEEMYSNSLHRGVGGDALMAGFYIYNNASIGLRCYAWGLLLGLGSLFVLVTEGVRNGAIFGYMVTTPQAINFFTFVTSHAPFELTAIVFSGAAGLRLGSGLVATKGQTRLASLKREAMASLPTAGTATVLFILAAFLEGFVSASALPYWAKAAIAIVCASMLIAFVALGGRHFRGRNAAVLDPGRG